MAALEAVGLVHRTIVATAVGSSVTRNRYTLSEAAQPFLREKNAQQMLCWGHKKLNEILHWTVDSWMGQQPPSAYVSYTYTVTNVAPWAENTDMRRAFPLIKLTLIDQERTQAILLQRTDTAWEAKD